MVISTAHAKTVGDPLGEAQTSQHFDELLIARTLDAVELSKCMKLVEIEGHDPAGLSAQEVEHVSLDDIPRDEDEDEIALPRADKRRKSGGLA